MSHDALVHATAAERSPFRHAAAIFDSDEGFLAEVVPFVEAGLEADHPVIVALDDRQQRLLMSAIGSPQAVSVLVGGDHYSHPLSALRANRVLFESHLRAGAARVRLVGELPRDDPSTWLGWARYEALCNHHLTDLPVSALCTYDTRATSENVLADVRRLHSQLADPDGRHVPSPDYVAPATFLEDWSRTAVDPMEAEDPEVSLADPRPADGRRAVAAVASAAGVGSEGIVSAVSEALANAYVHGRPPVTLRAWSTPGRVVVTVTDAGPGPSDPFTGLVAPDLESTHGRGLWIAHHFCDLLTISAGIHGCVVRMVGEAGSSPTA